MTAALLAYMVMYMRTLAVADFRANLRALLDDVTETHERVVITRNGTPAAVLLAVDDLESILETLDILADADLVAGIVEGQADIAAGRVHSTDEVLAGLESTGRSA